MRAAPKTALITGASSGFGRATAIRLAAAGYQLVLGARRLEALEALAAELAVPVRYGALDLRSADAIEAFFAALPEDFQTIDLLVNNAGLALGLQSFEATDSQDWLCMIETNITGLLRVTHRVLPGMVERNRGQIINIGSTAGNWPYPGSNVYGASKAFVQNFSRGLRADLLGRNIRVTNIEPGMAETEFSTVRFKGDQTRADSLYADTQPLRAEDIAEMIGWLATLPPHVNVNTLEVMPTCQAWGALPVDRTLHCE